MGWSDYSYTAATGKRPAFDGVQRHYTWFTPEIGDHPENLPESVFDGLAGGEKGEGNGARWSDYPSYLAAIAAANDAARLVERDRLEAEFIARFKAAATDCEAPAKKLRVIPKWVDCGGATLMVGLFFGGFFVQAYSEGYHPGKLVLGYVAFCGAWFVKFWFEPD